MERSEVDVCIIGNGPAASSVALMLIRHKISVALLGLPYSKKKNIGETLKPDIKVQLNQLDLWNDFINDNHLQSTGNRSAWGQTELTENNFMFHPHGYGWHIDRNKFDHMFLNAAKEQGALYFEPRLYTIDQNWKETFEIQLIHPNEMKQTLYSKIMVDASGRASWFCQRAEIKRLTFDKLCGFICFFCSNMSNDLDSMTLTEAEPNGWWYTALLPDNKRIVTFFSDYDLPICKVMRNLDGWKKMMDNTIHIRNIINKHNYKIMSGPFSIISNSTRMEKINGINWIAIGDAASTFDPLSSNGIINAIDDGLNASKLIMECLRGNRLWDKDHNTGSIEKYRSYLNKRVLYYRMEKRWSKLPFWDQNQKVRLL